MRVKKRKYTGIEALKKADLLSTNHLFSLAQPNFGFGDEAVFVNAVSMRPVTFVENHGRKRTLSGERWLTDS